MNNFFWVETANSAGEECKSKNEKLSSTVEVGALNGKAKISSASSFLDFHKSISGGEGVSVFGHFPGFLHGRTENLEQDKAKAELNFKKGLKRKLISSFENDLMDWWSESLAEKIVIEGVSINPSLAREAISELYVENSSNEKYLLCLMIALSHVSYSKVGSQAQLIGVAALSHKSLEVREGAIRMFEMWENSDCIDILRNHQVGPGWLMEYMLQVIEDFGG